MAKIINKSGTHLDTDWLPIIRYNYVRFTGASDEQARYRAPNDPRPILEEGEVYEVDTFVVRGSSTRVLLKDVDGQFNSVCFEGVPDAAAESDRPYYPDTPVCTVCREKLVLSGTGPRGMTMVCPEAKYAGGMKEGKRHYDDSRITLPDKKSLRVYALRQEIRRLRGEEDWA